jgi:hypothetical protein
MIFSLTSMKEVSFNVICHMHSYSVLNACMHANLYIHTNSCPNLQSNINLVNKVVETTRYELLCKSLYYVGTFPVHLSKWHFTHMSTGNRCDTCIILHLNRKAKQKNMLMVLLMGYKCVGKFLAHVHGQGTDPWLWKWKLFDAYNFVGIFPALQSMKDVNIVKLYHRHAV